MRIQFSGVRHPIAKVLAHIDLLAPFRVRPLRRPAGYAESHKHKGQAYHERFNKLPGRRLVWAMERDFLLSSTQEKIGTHLDFAGGTGRIAGAIEDRCATQIVLDVSESMLAIAASQLKNARIVCADFRSDPGIVPATSVDLVTAFRFFPNAEPGLRDAAMQFISRVLKRGGKLICNNHRNFWSLPYVAGRLVFSRDSSGGMKNKYLVALAERHGLSLVQSESMGVIPQNERFAPLPWSAMGAMESAIRGRWGSRHRMGYNVVFVFTKR